MEQNQKTTGAPIYDISQGGHYGASAAINQGLTGPSREILATYWQQTINHLETDTHDFKIHQLPLARIKKVMKADPEVKMISAEAPILFAKGCDIFITELTMRAWIHAEDNKRRTLQRSDIAAALAKSDMFDFLIDIVPREDSAGHGGGSKRPTTSGQGAAAPVPQQQPQQQMAPPDYGMPQHGAMGPPDQQYGRPQMYPAHMGGDTQQDPNQGYGQPPQMFGGGDMYNPYTQGQFGGGAQQMYSNLPGQRPQSQGYGGPRPGTAGRNEQVNEPGYGPG
ncbi:Transcriptional activator hap5 [Exophiala xenobiotica]|nr:Transcriptional activator hap5 [Exophiala xenobiotica]